MALRLFDFFKRRASLDQSVAIESAQQFVRQRRAVPSEERRRRRGIIYELPISAAAEGQVLPGPKLKPARNWIIQYQNIDPAGITRCDADIAIIDTSVDGGRDNLFSKQQIEVMRTSGGGKKVLAYMSIGEAEYCRFYWKDKWTKRGRKAPDAPPWLNLPNEMDWVGNWTVKFWDPAWQSIIIDRPDSFLNRIIDLGYDGVLLDVVNAYEYWMDDDRRGNRRPTAADDMIKFVQRIADHARVTRGKPDFAVVPIKGEQLLKAPQYVATISAICTEDIFFDQVGLASGKPRVRARSEDEMAGDLALIRLARDGDVQVLAMEYLLDWPEDAQRIAPARTRMRQLGLVPYFCKRNLHELSPPDPRLDGPAAVA